MIAPFRYVAVLVAACAAFAGRAEKLRVGCFFEPGFCEERAGGRLEGINVEWVERLAAAGGWEVERVDCAFRDGLAMLERGEIDVLPGIYRSAEREERLLFSHVPCGFAKRYLFVPSTSGLMPDSPASWHGLSVGVVEAFSQTALVASSARLKGVEPVFREYPTMSEAVEAMKSGKCQAVVATASHRLLDECRPLLELPGIPFYFCTGRDRAELIKRIDDALMLVYDEYPNIDRQLVTRNFPPVGISTVPLTPEELGWIRNRQRSGSPVHVELTPLRAPIKHVGQDGEAAGFVGRLLREITRRTGLEFKVLPPVDDASAQQRFNDGVSELWACFDADLVGVKDAGGAIPTIAVPQVVVRRAGVPERPLDEAMIAVDRGNTDRVAAYNRLGLMDRVVLCVDDEACVRSVIQGRADVFICSFSTAAECLRCMGCEDVVTVRPFDSPRYVPTYDLLVSAEREPILRAIITKTVRSFSQEEFIAMLYSSAASAARPFLSAAQIWAILSGAAILVLALLVFWSVRSSRRVTAALESSRAALAESARTNEELRRVNDLGGRLRQALTRLSGDEDNETKIAHTIREVAMILDADRATVVRYREDGTFERMLCWQRDEAKTLPQVHPSVPRRIADILKEQRSFSWPKPDVKADAVLDRLLKDFDCRSMSVTRLRVHGKIWGYASFLSPSTEAVVRDNSDLLMEVARLVEIAARRQELVAEISENRRNLERALAQAECAARAKTAFLSTMSQEIRTPLNAVIGFAEFLGRPGLSAEETREYTTGITSSSNALLALINDVLDLSKLDTDKEPMRERPCDLRKIFGEMFSIFRLRTGEKGVHLVPKIASDFPRVMLTEQRMRQIMLNLVGNAVRFTERGAVEFSAVAVPDGVGTVSITLKVADTGAGISEELLPHVFEPFGTDGNGRAHVYAGTGLGLPIVKRLVEAGGGTIIVDSREGVGTVFKLEFRGVKVADRGSAPGATAAASVMVPAVESGNAYGGDDATPLALPPDLRVLVVDDVPLNLRILSLYIHKLGVYFIQAASSGQKAMEIMRQERPNVVFTDLWMPGMTGAELAAEIRGNPDLASIPIVAVTADSDSDKSFDTAVFNRVITKPVTSAKVREIFLSLYPSGAANRKENA